MAAQLLRSGTSPLFETEPNRTITILMVGLQGFLGGLTLLGIYTAVEYVPLHNGSAIFFCTPVLFDFFLFSSWILHWIKMGNFIWRPFALKGRKFHHNFQMKFHFNPFWIFWILIFFVNEIVTKSSWKLFFFFCFVTMKVSHKLCDRMNGTQFWCFS